MTGCKSKQHSCSLELQSMDHIFRQYVKQDFTNHSLSTAHALLTGTRGGRSGFLKITLAPVWDAENNKFEYGTITGTKVLWLNKQRVSNGIIISLHGGAYISGTAESCLPYLLPLAYRTKMAGLSINYSLSPEVILPYQINEVFEIYKYLMTEMKISNKDIIFVGDSAGASLLILLIQKLIKLDAYRDKLPLCAVTMSSWDVPSDGKSYEANRETDSLMDDKTGKVWGHFAVGNLDINGNIMEENEKKFDENMNDNADASYLHEDNLWTFEQFPPVFLSVSEWECVLDDSLRVKEQMDKYEDASECVLHVTKGTGIHVLEDFHGHGLPEADELIQKEAEWILKQHNSSDRFLVKFLNVD